MTIHIEYEFGKISKIMLWIFVLVGLAILFIVYIDVHNSNKNGSSTTSAQPSQESDPYDKANDSPTQHDALSQSAVKTGTLRQYIQSVAGKPIDTSSLNSEINAIIKQNPDITFGIAITDLKRDDAHSYGNTKAMTAASMTKVLTAVFYLHQVEQGIRDLETVMPNGQTAQQNIEQMIVLSDNTSWHLLNENLGYQNLQNYAHSIGLSSYSYADNSISSGDTAKLFGDLYERKLINETHSELLLSYMERANYREFILPAVPDHDTAYHKVGYYGLNLNDAAIITNGSDTIVLSIYTESSTHLDQHRIATVMQQITTPTLATFHLD